jgi:hypothetical protein
MKKMIRATAILALLSAATATLAAPSSMGSGDTSPTNYWPGKTWYLEATGGTNFGYLGVLSSNTTNTSSGIRGWGWSAAAGYNFTDYFALEAGYMQNYARIQTDNGDFDGNKQYVNGHTNIPYFTSRFTIPMYTQFAFIGKLGVMYASATGTGPDSNGDGKEEKAKSPDIALPYVGIGAGYSFTPHIQLVAQYQGAVYGIVGAGLLSLGVDYRF